MAKRWKIYKRDLDIGKIYLKQCHDDKAAFKS